MAAPIGDRTADGGLTPATEVDQWERLKPTYHRVPFHVFDHEAREQALAKAAEACRERDPVKRRDLEEQAINLWQQAFGR